MVMQLTIELYHKWCYRRYSKTMILLGEMVIGCVWLQTTPPFLATLNTNTTPTPAKQHTSNITPILPQLNKPYQSKYLSNQISQLKLFSVIITILL